MHIEELLGTTICEIKTQRGEADGLYRFVFMGWVWEMGRHEFWEDINGLDLAIATEVVTLRK